MAMRNRRYTTRRPVTPRRTRTTRAARPWTREEIAFMRKFYRNYETAWVARQLGRTVYSVRYKAVDLNIKKASPSIWRGNFGKPNDFTFRKPTTRRSFKSTTRRTTKRRTNRPRTYRATTITRQPRRTNRRRTRRTVR